MQGNLLLFREQTVLYAEDDPVMRKEVAEILEMLFRKVYVARDGVEAMAIYEEERPDIVLADVKMPGKDGMSLLRAIRKEDYDTPVILLTSFAEQDLLLAAANLSVDGYVVKPVRLEQMINVMGKAVKRITRNTHPLELAEGVVYNMATRELYREGRPIPLGPKEQLFLQLLIRNHPRTVSREEVFLTVWPMESVGDTALRSLVFHLHKKLETALVATVRGVGYRLKDCRDGREPSR